MPIFLESKIEVRYFNVFKLKNVQFRSLGEISIKQSNKIILLANSPGMPVQLL